MIEAREYVAYAQRLHAAATTDAERAHAGRELEFARVYADHDALLAERGALDFGDLALHAFRLLHEKPHVRERARPRATATCWSTSSRSSSSPRASCCGCSPRTTATSGRRPTTTRRSTGCAARGARTSTTSAREYPDARVVRLERSYRYGRRILRAAEAVLEEGAGEREPKEVRARGNGSVRFWRARSERAQAQAVAADVERLLTQDGVLARAGRRARALGARRGAGGRARRSRSARSRSG